MTRKILPSGRVFKNWDLELKRKKRWRDRNKKKIAEYDKNYKKLNSVAYKRYASCAKNRKIKFELTEKQFIEFKNRECSYCGDKIDGYGIDRVDNDIGYTMGNTTPCCAICNLMKYKHSVGRFINHIRKIYETYPKESKE